MLIKKDGIFRNIDPKEFGIFQSMGFEKVISEPVKVKEPTIKEEKLEPIDETKLGETNIEAKPIVDELPKSKKKKK